MSKHPNKPVIRLARNSDACDIALLSRNEIEYGLPWAWRPGAVATAIANSNMNVAIATSAAVSPLAAEIKELSLSPDAQQHLCGFAIVYFGRTHAHINLLAVDQSWRRRGVGRELLEWQVSSARTAGIRYLTLEVRNSNKAAQTFYQDCGFEVRETVRNYYNNREDALRLARKLEVQHES